MTTANLAKKMSFKQFPDICGAAETDLNWILQIGDILSITTSNMSLQSLLKLSFALELSCQWRIDD